jgi:hypothetical protein
MGPEKGPILFPVHLGQALANGLEEHGPGDGSVAQDLGEAAALFR